MSHFSVLAPADNEDDLTARLLPYHEYESTGIEAYIQFVPADMDKLRAKYARYNDNNETFDEWIPGWCGAHRNENGVWGHITNPNKRWDWWTIGGSWSGFFQLDPDFVSSVGEIEEITASGPIARSINYCLAGWVDWERMRQDQIEYAKTKWWAWQSLPPKPSGNFDRDNPAWQAWYKAMDDTGLLFYVESEVIENDLCTLPLDEYAAKYGAAKAMTFAYLDLAGTWHERATMGWFAVSYNQNADYEREWWTFVETLPADQRIYIVDCHI